MLNETITGVVNVDLESLDAFRSGEETRTVALPRELLDFPDQEELETWACQRGLIRQGEHLAVTG